MALDEVIKVESTEQLDSDSSEIINLCHANEELIQRIEDEEAKLEGWVSAKKEEYIAMLKRMAAKERELIEIALSYGEVGVQQAAIFEGTEEAISALASKINDEMMG